MTVPSVSLELHRAIVREYDRSASDILATNTALAERVTELEAALDKAADELAAARNNEAVLAARCESMNAVQIALAQQMAAAQDDAARLRAALKQVEYVSLEDRWFPVCAWCERGRDDAHAPDCARQAALAQTGGEVKA